VHGNNARSGAANQRAAWSLGCPAGPRLRARHEDTAGSDVADGASDRAFVLLEIGVGHAVGALRVLGCLRHYLFLRIRVDLRGTVEADVCAIELLRHRSSSSG